MGDYGPDGDYKGVVDRSHKLLDAAGIPPAMGAPCDNANCRSHLEHRIGVALLQVRELEDTKTRYRNALEDEQSSRASLIDVLNTELRDSLPQSEQADVGSDLRYYLRLLVDQVRAQERKTEKFTCDCGEPCHCGKVRNHYCNHKVIEKKEGV